MASLHAQCASSESLVDQVRIMPASTEDGIPAIAQIEGYSSSDSAASVQAAPATVEVIGDGVVHTATPAAPALREQQPSGPRVETAQTKQPAPKEPSEEVITDMFQKHKISLQYANASMERSYLEFLLGTSSRAFYFYVAVWVIPPLFFISQTTVPYLVTLNVASLIITGLAAALWAVVSYVHNLTDRALHPEIAILKEWIMCSFVVAHSLVTVMTYGEMRVECAKDFDVSPFQSRGHPRVRELHDTCRESVFTFIVATASIMLISHFPRFVVCMATCWATLFTHIGVRIAYGWTPADGQRTAIIGISLFLIAVLRLLREVPQRRQFERAIELRLTFREVQSQVKGAEEFVGRVLPQPLVERFFTRGSVGVDYAPVASCAVVEMPRIVSESAAHMPATMAQKVIRVTRVVLAAIRACGVEQVSLRGDVFLVASNLLTPEADHCTRVLCFAFRVVAQLTAIGFDAGAASTSSTVLFVGTSQQQQQQPSHALPRPPLPPLENTSVAPVPSRVQRHSPSSSLCPRIVAHTGTIIGAIVGHSHVRYDVFGDAFEVARSLHVCCDPGAAYVTERTRNGALAELASRRAKQSKSTADRSDPQVHNAGRPPSDSDDDAGTDRAARCKPLDIFTGNAPNDASKQRGGGEPRDLNDRRCIVERLEVYRTPVHSSHDGQTYQLFQLTVKNFDNPPPQKTPTPRSDPPSAFGSDEKESTSRQDDVRSEATTTGPYAANSVQDMPSASAPDSGTVTSLSGAPPLLRLRLVEVGPLNDNTEVAATALPQLRQISNESASHRFGAGVMTVAASQTSRQRLSLDNSPAFPHPMGLPFRSAGAFGTRIPPTASVSPHVAPLSTRPSPVSPPSVAGPNGRRRSETHSRQLVANPLSAVPGSYDASNAMPKAKPSGKVSRTAIGLLERVLRRHAAVAPYYGGQVPLTKIESDVRRRYALRRHLALWFVFENPAVESSFQVMRIVWDARRIRPLTLGFAAWATTMLLMIIGELERMSASVVWCVAGLVFVALVGFTATLLAPVPVPRAAASQRRMFVVSARLSVVLTTVLLTSLVPHLKRTILANDAPSTLLLLPLLLGYTTIPAPAQSIHQALLFAALVLNVHLAGGIFTASIIFFAFFCFMLQPYIEAQRELRQRQDFADIACREELLVALSNHHRFRESVLRASMPAPCIELVLQKRQLIHSLADTVVVLVQCPSALLSLESLLYGAERVVPQERTRQRGNASSSFAVDSATSTRIDQRSAAVPIVLAPTAVAADNQDIAAVVPSAQLHKSASLLSFEGESMQLPRPHRVSPTAAASVPIPVDASSFNATGATASAAAADASLSTFSGSPTALRGLATRLNEALSQTRHPVEQIIAEVARELHVVEIVGDNMMIAGPLMNRTSMHDRDAAVTIALREAVIITHRIFQQQESQHTAQQPHQDRKPLQTESTHLPRHCAVSIIDGELPTPTKGGVTSAVDKPLDSGPIASLLPPPVLVSGSCDGDVSGHRTKSSDARASEGAAHSERAPDLGIFPSANVSQSDAPDSIAAGQSQGGDSGATTNLHARSLSFRELVPGQQSRSMTAANTPTSRAPSTAPAGAVAGQSPLRSRVADTSTPPFAVMGEGGSSSEKYSVILAHGFAVSVLAFNDAYPVFYLLGPIVNQARGLASAAPLGSCLCTEHFSRSLLTMCGPSTFENEGLRLRPAARWAINGLGLIRVHTIDALDVCRPPTAQSAAAAEKQEFSVTVGTSVDVATLQF